MGEGMVRADEMVERLYEDRTSASQEEILQAALDAKVPADILYYFYRLPKGRYTERELVERVNGMIRDRRREGEIGLLSVGRH